VPPGWGSRGVSGWEAAAEVREDGTLAAVRLTADPRSLRVRDTVEIVLDVVLPSA
jgi:hypothetical protein